MILRLYYRRNYNTKFKLLNNQYYLIESDIIKVDCKEEAHFEQTSFCFDG